MADPALLTVLTYAHVLSAVGWLGGAILTAFVLGPGLQKTSAPTRLEFTAKVMPKIIRYIVGTITGTLVFGFLLLYFVVGGNFSMLSPSTTFGGAISVGIALALVTVAIAMTVTIPSFRKMIAIAEELLKSGQQTPPPELMKYSERARTGSVVGAVLLLVVLIMMVTAGFY